MRRIAVFVVLSVLVGVAALPVPASGAGPGADRAVEVPWRTAGRAPERLPRAIPATLAHDGAGPADSLPRPERRPATIGSPQRAATRTPTADGLDADLMGPDPLVSPGDPTGATGPTSVLAAVNVRVGVYDRTGAKLLQPFRLRSMSGQLAGLHETDPKVFYDAYDDMFVLAFLVYDKAEGFIEVVTIPSATADDTSTWCRTHMVGDQVRNGKHEFADYPSIGFTTNRVVVTTNNFGFNNGPFRYAQIVSMPKKALYDDPTCSKTVPIEVRGGAATRNPDGSKAFTLQAATAAGGAPTDQFLVSLEAQAGSTRLVLWRLRMIDGDLVVAKTAKSVKRVGLPPYGYQCGSTNNATTWWDTGDLRVTSAFFDAGANRLYAATAVAGNAGGGIQESVIRWYEARPSNRLGRSSVLREGTVASANRDAAWPAIATNDAGTLFVGYARGGKAECLSVWAATIAAGAGTAAQTALVRLGEARYQFGPGVERWGDYGAANRDPVIPADVAVFGAFARDQGSSTTDAFRAHVALLSDI
ncbi:MAG TPA: hypothetical protein VJM84_03900 [Actinomycetota bacterium]|nr:hypothetical protein [Actinomycetota bacterium]